MCSPVESSTWLGDTNDKSIGNVVIPLMGIFNTSAISYRTYALTVVNMLLSNLSIGGIIGEGI